MDEPRTHYQLSFTVRQGLLLFVALLCALGVAYALGLMTGLAGRGSAPAPSSPGSAAPAADSTPSTPVPAATSPLADLELPRPIRGVAAGPGSRSSVPVPGSARRTAEPAPTAIAVVAAALPGPTPSPGLQLFEDEAASEPTPVASHGGVGKTSSARKTAADAGASRKGAAHAADDSASFWVQATLASTEKEARAQRDRLTARGYSVVVVPGTVPGSHTRRVFRVRVGPYPNREAADRAAARLRTREKLRPWVVPPGK